jgi:predicted PurR-regulated permease PerM
MENRAMSKKTTGLLSLSIMIILAGVVILGLGDALVPLLIATFLSYLLLPLVKKLEAKGIRKETAVAAALAVAGVVGVVAIMLLLPVLIQDLRALGHSLPRIAETAIHKLETIAARLDLELPLSKEELVSQAKAYLSNLPVGALKSASLFFGKALTGTVGLILSVLNLLLIPVFFFHVIADYERMVNGARSLIPPEKRPWFDSFLNRSNQVVSAYFRGQFLVSLILGILYGLGFWLADLRFGLVIGLITGLLNVIPIAGPLIGLGLASVVALANFDGIGSIFSVWAAFAVVQGLESFVITPRIVGDRVGLNALETMIALIVGGNLGGFVGMLVAIPVAGILKFVLADSKAHYFKSDFYQNG